MGTENNYPDFEFPSNDLCAYIVSTGKFIISLRDGSMINFTPEDAEGFEKWLTRFGVRDVLACRREKCRQKAGL